MHGALPLCFMVGYLDQHRENLKSSVPVKMQITINRYSFNFNNVIQIYDKHISQHNQKMCVPVHCSYLLIHKNIHDYFAVGGIKMFHFIEQVVILVRMMSNFNISSSSNSVCP
jgi:hypothetical protein